MISIKTSTPCIINIAERIQSTVTPSMNPLTNLAKSEEKTAKYSFCMKHALGIFQG